MLDERTGRGTGAYGELFQLINEARVSLQEGREALRLYAPGTSALQSQLQILEANTVIWLAENWCSGVPLSAVHLTGDPQPTGAFTTDEVLRRAIAMFDSAVTLNTDSTRFVYLAKVGRARAWLDLGEPDSAAATAHDVPTDFVYYARYNQSVTPNAIGNTEYGRGQPGVWVEDREGGTGMLWSADPRTAMTVTVSGNMPATAKYSVAPGTAGTPNFQAAVVTSAPNTPVRVADGVEARLIEAEAALRRGDPAWVTILNTLRHDCIGTAACATVPGLTSANLPNTLTDPGSDSLRVDQLFRERAMWLYLTAHREGDLRRLVRQYHRRPEDLWPQGVYVNPGFPPLEPTVSDNGSSYGTDVVFTPDETSQRGGNETSYNPLYHGCINFDP
jgi:hypothetical protein